MAYCQMCFVIRVNQLVYMYESNKDKQETPLPKARQGSVGSYDKLLFMVEFRNTLP